MYKYSSKHQSIEGSRCPPEDLVFANNAEAYRFTQNPISENCFLPVAAIKPNRLIGKKSEEQCSMYALSMFDTVEQAKRRMEKLTKINSELKNILGSWLAKGVLSNDLGMKTISDSKGHFDFHEFSVGSVSSCFIVTEKL